MTMPAVIPADLAIRPATHADVDAIVALMESAYRGESGLRGWTTESDLLAGQRTDTREVGENIAAPGHVVLTAFEGDRLIGTAHVARLTPEAEFAYFGAFAVAPDRQAIGLGKQLLVHAEDYARRALGSTVMRLCVIHTRAELIAFYQRRGYRATGETEPFPYDQPRFGLPKQKGLTFVWFEKPLY